MKQPALIPDCAPAALPAATSIPKRGRGATPRVERTFTLPQPNPAGRRILTYRFRPLKRHQIPFEDPSNAEPKEIWQVACNLIAEYFGQIGGFRLADDAVVTAWSDLVLSGGFTIAEINWAIVAKAASLHADDAEERHAKRIYVNRPANFASPNTIEEWLFKARAVGIAPPLSNDELTSRKVDLAVRGINPADRDRREAQLLDLASKYPDQPRTMLIALRDEARNVAVWEALSERRRRLVNHRVRHEQASRFADIDRGPDEHLYKAMLRMCRYDVACQLWPEQAYHLLHLGEKAWRKARAELRGLRAAERERRKSTE